MRRMYRMSCGRRAWAFASCRPWYGDKWWVTNLYVPPHYRGRGYGQRIMERICETADYYGIELVLEAVAGGGLPQADLEAWYNRLGFAPDGVGMFRRQPQGAIA
jgi:GNAT superfamily N-acetyltransferase